MTTDNTSGVETGSTKMNITEQAIDHAVDGLAVLALLGAAYVGAADMTVVGGIVSVALGKRVMGGK